MFRKCRIKPPLRNTRSKSTFSHKVHAIPFNHHPDQARSNLGWAGPLCLGTPRAVLTSLGEFLLGPGFVQSKARLKEFQPVYLPTWRVDAEVEAKAWVGKDSTQTTVTAHSVKSFFPGFDLDPLCRLSLNIGDDETNAEPWSDSMLTYHGHAVTALPFTASPLRLPDFVRSLGSQECRISDDWRFQPSSIKCTAMAAYPLMYPVYLATMEEIEANEDGSSRYVNIVIDGHKPDGRFVAWDKRRWLGGSSMPLFPFLTMSPYPVDNVTPRGRADQLTTYIDNGVANGLSSELLVQEVDWDDLRIRPYTMDEIRAMRQWLLLRVRAEQTRRMIESIPDSARQGKIIRVDIGKTRSSPLSGDKLDKEHIPHEEFSAGGFRAQSLAGDDFTKLMREELAKTEQAREDTKMGWLKEWEAQQEQARR